MSLALNKTLIKRIPVQVDYRDDISCYGIDNLYPQRVEEIAFRSPIATRCLNTLSDFLEGGGFIDNGDFVVNREEQTLNDLLREATLDDAKFAGFALHINVDEIGGVTEISRVKFKDVRYGLPNRFGRIEDVKVNVNWEEDYNKSTYHSRDIFPFPLWSKRDTYEIEDIEEFSGYILYWTPEKNVYPKCTFDSSLDSVQTNGEIQVFEIGSLQNSFLGTTIFKQQGEIESDEEEQILVNELAQLTGAENAGSVMVVNVPEGFDGDILEQIPANNNDRLFELTNKTSENRVVYTFAVPKAVLGIEPESGMFNVEQEETAHNSYNTRTRKRRTSIAKVFDDVLSNWHTGPMSITGIKEQPFGVMTDDEIDEIEEVEETKDINKSENSSISLNIMNRVSINELTLEQGVTALKEFSGLSEEVAIQLLTK